MPTQSPLEQESYLRFRDTFAERTSNIVFWIGSGLSAGYGVPSWRGLRQKLQRCAEGKANSLSEPDKTAQLAKIQSIAAISDNWKVFGLLKEVLGQSTYETSIRAELSPATDALSIDIYDRLWELGPTGVLSLNLDRLLIKSFSKVNPGKDINMFEGRDVGGYTHLLKTQKPFIAALHGTLENSRSWVFTKSELTNLLSNRAYATFVNSILTSRTIVFLGITADDQAVGGFLEKLREENTSFGPHFWITDKTNLETDNWAEKNCTQVIRYVSKNNDHSQLAQIFKDLQSYIPKDNQPLPVKAELAPTEEIPEPGVLRKRDPEEIRDILNRYAAKLLSDYSATSLAKYKDFCGKYAYEIHNAWFMTEVPPNNKFFGYAIEDKIGEGGFGKVYRAKRDDGEYVAVKLLREEVRDNADMLTAFRRGVQSMRILSENKIQGMVPYKTAFEMPACAIMDLVNGPNLKEAVISHSLETISDRVRVALDLVRIIRRGHSLPERVLHRDIRPENIMLSDFYINPDAWKVLVLDFDLSWHRDALGKSVDIKSSAVLGYAAPEQLAPNPKVSTRNALVDSFGIGMTLYFLFSGKEPGAGESMHERWREIVFENIMMGVKSNRRFIATRISRLIIHATEAEQSKRIDLANIEYELERICGALSSDDKPISLEFLVDEALSEAFGENSYEWDGDKSCGERGFHSGLKIGLCANDMTDTVGLKVGWASTGNENKYNVMKYASTAKERVVSILKRREWDVTVDEIGNGWEIKIVAEISSGAEGARLVQLVDVVKQIGKEIRFD